MRVVWSERALERVDEIARYIAQDDREAAIRWTVGLFEEVERLGEFPESGRMVPEPGTPGLRELLFGVYRVFYEVGSTVEVLSVRHGSRLVREEEILGD